MVNFLKFIFLWIFHSSILSNAPVHDAISSGHLLSILSKAEKNIDTLLNLGDRIKKVNKAIASPLSIESKLNLQKMENITKKYWMKYDLNHPDHGQYKSHIRTIENHYLIPKNTMSKNQYHHIREKGKKLLKENTISALALSKVQVDPNHEIQSSLQNIHSRMKRTKNMHEETRLINQQLILINESLLQIQEINSKQLSIIASLILHMNINVFEKSHSRK